MCNKLYYKTIKELNNYHFIVPNYQRGYRWNKIQIEQFIDDIYEEKNTEYYIQPLIVSEICNEREKWDIVDGQQRLTTILIMIGALRYINKNILNKCINMEEMTSITLEYESRKNSKKFLDFLVNPDKLVELSQNDLNLNMIWEKFCENENEPIEKNLDFEYMIYAFREAVRKYTIILEELTYNWTELKDELLERCKFIWYPIEVDFIEDKRSFEIEQFSKINMGKIELTDAELIKAEFMNPKRLSVNNEVNSRNFIKAKQFSISEAWYIIEKELHKPDFWGFIPHQNQYNFKENYHTRIDILFEFLLLENALENKKTIEEHIEDLNLNYRYSLFLRVLKYLESSGIDKTWEKVKDIFENLKELYEEDGRTQIYDNRKSMYNLISFIVYYQQNKEKRNDLVYLKNYKIFYELLKKNRNKQVDYIKEKIKEIVFEGKFNGNIDEKIKNMRYDTEGEELREILLLYNIVLLSQTVGIGNRYNFLKYSKQKWTREHIFPSQFNKLNNCNENSKKLFMERKEILQLITKNLDANKNIVLRNEIILRYINFLYGKENYYKLKNGDLDKNYKCPIKCCKKGIINFYGDENEINNLIKNEINDKYLEAYGKKLELIKRSSEVLEIIEIMEQIDKFISQIDENIDLIIEFIESNKKILKNIDDQVILFEFYKDNINGYEIENLEKYINSNLKEFNNIPIKYKNEITSILMKYEDELSSRLISNSNIININSKIYNDSIFHERLVDNFKNEFKKILIDLYKYNIDNIRSTNYNENMLNKILKITNKSIADNINYFFEKEFNMLNCDNSIGNMTLLEDVVNQSEEIGNRPYNEKKVNIYEKTKKGAFVPIATLLAFTDVYSKKRITDKYWMYESRYEYLYDIINTIKDFLK
ncbi:DUF262 domain-containing protein [Clostridium butyricum]|uniref:DUF262 domain-containing protein n=1 Tax=Clostridium butyricum TaxID=1492 RepID=UPI00374E5082